MNYHLEIVEKDSGKFYRFKHSYRENGKVKNKRIYLGKEEIALKLLMDFSTKKPDKEILLSYSGELILSKIAKTLQFSEVINEVIQKRAKFDVGHFMTLLVIERCLNNVSKWGLAQKVHQNSFFSLDPLLKEAYFVEDNIYNYMDYISPVLHKIQSRLVERLLRNGQVALDEFILDGTSIHCYGEDTEENEAAEDEAAEEGEPGDDEPIPEAEGALKRKRGYSRSKRPDLAQINLILGVNGQYFPLLYETFSGNTADVVMFEHILALAQTDYPHLLEAIQNRYLIFDRGNNNPANLKEVDAICHKWQFYFIAGIRSSMVRAELSSLKKEALTEIYVQKKTRLYGKTMTKKIYGKDRLVLLYLNEETALRKKDQFLTFLDKIQKAIALVTQKGTPLEEQKQEIDSLLKKYHLRRCFEVRMDEAQVTCTPIESKLQAKTALFGKFALITNDFRLQAAEIVRIYKTNKIVEREFHLLKSLFQIGPFFHRRPDRIRTHFALVTWGILFCAFLRSYLIQNQMAFSFEELLDILKSGYLSMGEYNYPGSKMFVISKTLNINEPLKKILHVLDLKYEYFDIKVGSTQGIQSKRR